MPKEVLLLASAARTATGNAVGALALGGMKLAILIDVTAISGAGATLAPSIEWSQDGGTTFAQADPADTMTSITAAGTKVKIFDVKGSTYRVVYTITGTTPSITFSIRQLDG